MAPGPAFRDGETVRISREWCRRTTRYCADTGTVVNANVQQGKIMVRYRARADGYRPPAVFIPVEYLSR